jgi:hypothetical protein
MIYLGLANSGVYPSSYYAIRTKDGVPAPRMSSMGNSPLRMTVRGDLAKLFGLFPDDSKEEGVLFILDRTT